MLKQKHWRTAGLVCILSAGAMAIGSVTSEILKNTILLLLSFTNEDAAERAASLSIWPYLLYWLFFLLLILASFYFALLDMRYIKLKFAIEKRNLIKETLEDPTLSEISTKKRDQ